MKRKWIVLAGILVVFSLISMVLVVNIYNRQFPRFPRPDETVTAQIRYQDIAHKYPRETMGFQSGNNILQGYLYGANTDLGLLVLSHGIGGGADSYLPQIRYFVDEGWLVFAYDSTGSYDSEGKSTKGFPQALLDLDAALWYIQSHEDLSQHPVVLFGHSWGGYAAACALHLEHEIQGVVTVSAANSAMEMIMEQGRSMLGGFIETQRPFLWLYQRILFGSVVSLQADDAIRNADVPVLIIHGIEDNVISFTGSAIISKADTLGDAPVAVIVMDAPERNGHNDLFRSQEAIAYYHQVNGEFRLLYDEHGGDVPYDVLQAFYAGIDRDRIQELDPVLMNQIQVFLLQCLE